MQQTARLDDVFPSAAKPKLRSDLRRHTTPAARQRQQSLERKAKKWLNRLRLGETVLQIGADEKVSKQYVSLVLNKFYDRETIAQACHSRVAAKHSYKLGQAHCAQCGQPVASLDGGTRKYCSRQCLSDALSMHKAKIKAMEEARAEGKTWPQIAEQFHFKNAQQALSTLRRYQQREASRLAPGINKPVKNTELYVAVQRAIDAGEAMDDLAERFDIRPLALETFCTANRMRIEGATKDMIAATIGDASFENRVEAVRRVLRQKFVVPAEAEVTALAALDDLRQQRRRWSSIGKRIGLSAGVAQSLHMVLNLRVRGLGWPEIIAEVEPGRDSDSFIERFDQLMEQVEMTLGGEAVPVPDAVVA